MATRDSFLVNWIKTAYSMELGLVPMLEKQRTQLQGDPELGRAIDLHLERTRQHADLLRGRLQAMGESFAAIQPAAPVTAALGQPDGNGPDRTQQTELVDYVTEAFESASYRALKALAIQLGDHETSRICDQILQDETAMTQALERRLPGHNGTEAGAGRSSQREGSMEQDNARIARANFDALNAHDLDRFQRDLASDFRGEAPGMPGEIDREQNRAYVQAYLTAFPDLHFDIERVIPAGDHVIVDWLGTGTHTGPMATPDGRTIPPTGKVCRVKGSTHFEFRQGKIGGSRVLFDTGEMMRQLGLLPGSATNAAGQRNRDIIHIEIPASDPRAAAEFYGKMFGWEHEEMGDMNYTTFKSGNVGGGFAPVGEVYQPGVVILYVGTDDIDGELRRAGALGAKTIVPKTEIPGMGWFAIFADPTGNRFGLFSM